MTEDNNENGEASAVRAAIRITGVEDSRVQRRLHRRGRLKRRRFTTFSGLITLLDGKELVVVDATKGRPPTGTVVVDTHLSSSGDLILVTADNNVLTCREAEQEDKYPRLEPEWLTARIKELVRYDAEMGFDENLATTKERLPTGEELGILPGQLWVRRVVTNKKPLPSIRGYPHMIQVASTNSVWCNLVSVNIVLPDALDGLTFNIKPTLLGEAYELYLTEASYL